MEGSRMLFLSFFLITAFSGLYAQVTDIDGNQYPTVIIGTQEWMAENLRTGRLNDETVIPDIISLSSWISTSEPATCWHYNDSALHHYPYGRMYNGFAALHPSLCPTGWHVPTSTEWDQMVTFLGGVSVAGGKLKHAGFQYWEQPNTGATNSSGFSGLPGGFRSNVDGNFQYKGFRGGWYVTVAGNDLAFRFLSWDLESAGSGVVPANGGLSIRCMRTASPVQEPPVHLLPSKIYPNPASDFVTISWPAIKKGNICETIVSDRLGRQIRRVALTEQETEMDVSDLKPGFYLVSLLRDGAVITSAKLVVAD